MLRLLQDDQGACQAGIVVDAPTGRISHRSDIHKVFRFCNGVLSTLNGPCRELIRLFHRLWKTCFADSDKALPVSVNPVIPQVTQGLTTSSIFILLSLVRWAMWAAAG